MTLKSEKPAWEKVLLMTTIAVAIAVSAIQPAMADYRRSCRASLEVRQAGTNTARRAYQWTVYNTVTLYAQVNEARREARRAIVNCVQTHWDARDAEAAPYSCQSQGSLEVREYPFENLAERLRDDLCAANPREFRQDVDLVLFIEGERGCVVDGGNINPATRVDIASGYRINCPIPSGESWACVGEGCEPPLPGIRLPGNDVGDSDIPGQDWRVCEQMCEETPACGAWTWRAAGTSGPGSPERCLLKSRAGTQIHDSCCHSGIRN
jgi:hypothetical protein